MRWLRLNNRMSPSFLVAGFAAVIGFFVCLRRIGDFDYWTHLALGRAYWAAGTVRIGEPFVISRLGQPLQDVEWLFQALLYPLHLIVSDIGISLTIALAAGTVFYLLALHADEYDAFKAYVAVGYLMVTAAGVQFRFLPRPEALAYLLLAVCLLLARVWQREPGRKVLLLIAAVVALWVPLHVSWTIGATITLLYLVIRPHPDFWRTQLQTRTGRIFMSLTFLVIATGLYKASAFARMVVGQVVTGQALAGITEMRPLWELPELFRRCGLAAIIALLLSWGQRPGRPGRMAVWGASACLGVVVARNGAFALLAMVPVALQGLGSYRPMIQPLKRRIISGLIVAVGLVSLVVSFADKDWGVGVEWHLFPREAAEFVRTKKLPAPVFNNWDCGGYLDWAWNGRPATFLDGRLGDTVTMAEHDAIVDGVDPAGAISRLGIRTILVQPLYFNNGRIISGLFWLLSNPEWQPVFAGDALVFVKGALPGATQLAATTVWRVVARQIEILLPSMATTREHLLYSLAVARLFSGDAMGSRTAMTEAMRQHPELAAQYREIFPFLNVRYQ